MPNTDASFIQSLPPNVAVQFLDRVKKSPQLEAFRYPVGESWESVTWKEAGDEVAKMAAGLLALGIEPEQRVGIASGTRYEWILADLGIMCAGAATTTVYPSTNEEDTAYILADSECQVVFAEDDEQLAKLKARKSELPHVQKVVTFDGTRPTATGSSPWPTWRSSARSSSPRNPGVIEDTAETIKGDQLATLIYTSGTTGRPKGVRLRHSSWVYEGEAIRAQDILDETDLRVPLAADGALVRQGADVDADGLRVRGRDRRPGRQDRREPRHREADVHGRRAAHLREGPRSHRHHAGRRGRRQGEDLQQGLRGRPQGRPAQARGQAGADGRSASSTRSSTSSSSTRSATASADGCASSSPGPRRSTATSPSGSTPPAS